MHRWTTTLALLALFFAAPPLACDDGGGTDADADVDTDADTDVDTDTDGDADTDVDTDVDTDADSDGDGDADGVEDGGADADASSDGGDADADEDVEPRAGFGVISGACGVLDDAEWSSTAPFLFRAVIDFGTETFEPSLLSAGAQEILAEGTAGGSSGDSEAIAFDLLYRCEGAELLLSETEVEYLPDTPAMTDFLARIDGRNVAVSVTRAFHYPTSEPCPVADLETLLADKLEGVLDAEAFAAPSNPWDRSILSIIAYDEQCADAAEDAYAAMDAATRADTIVMITVAEGEDGFLY